MPVYFQTAPDTPSERVCRTFQIPSSQQWLGIFNALRPILLSPYNWEQVNDTDLTIEESLAIVEVMFNEYWETENCCDGEICITPDGTRVIRLGVGGHIQQMGNGAWEAPTGDYAVPEIEPREGGTASERRCLAAANATNVLAKTYEVAADNAASVTGAAEMAVLLATFLTLEVAPFFGFIVPAFIVLLEAQALAFIEIAKYMTADLWTEDFSEKLKCMLYECSSDDAGVVTFDWDCINAKLAEDVDLLNPLWEIYLRLFGQVTFILNIIGIDGLNVAGTTTEVTFASCAGCDDCADCSIETATTTSFDLYTAEEIDGWLPPTDSIFGTGLMYIRTQANGGSLSLADSPRCVIQIGVAGVNRFPGYPSLQLYAEIEGVEYEFDSGNNVILDSPVVTDAVLLYIKEGDNGYMSVNAFSISWCTTPE